MTLTYIIGYNNVGANGNSQKEIHHYTDYRAIATHCSHGPRGVVTAYHGHIHRIERLLQYAARYQR